jgi:arginase family enzyme
LNQVVILAVLSQAGYTSAQIILAELSQIGIHTLNEMTEPDPQELYEVSHQIIQDGKFLVTLGNVPDITSSLVKAQLEKWPSMKVLQIDAQRLHQANQDPEWFVKIVDDLPEHVYFTFQLDGMNLDEVTWREMMNLTRELTHRRNVVGLDLIVSALQDDQALFCAKLLYEFLALIFQSRKHGIN